MNNIIIRLADKESCSGCGVCADACSRNCITMLRYGLHIYPSIDAEQCISCQKCMKVCPSINKLDFVDVNLQKYYACWHKDIETVKTSTSGGAGSALAEHAIEQGYYVVGAVLEEDGFVRHVLATNKEEIKFFKGSKYVQSDTKGVFMLCIKAIKEGHKILFIGTPCQTEAMKRMLPAKLQANLLTCSIICHGVNSPFVWKDYYDNLQKKYKSHFETYNFRSKSHGWQKKSGGGNLRISYEMASGIKKDVPAWRNLFHHWFGQHYIMRPSCFNCQYRTEARHSDIVIGDFWNVEKILDGMDTYNGVSVLITTTERGECFLHSNLYLNAISVDAEKSKGVLKGLINRKSQDTLNKEKKRAKDFETIYCKNGFVYMARNYPCPTYFDQIINKIKSLI